MKIQKNFKPKVSVLVINHNNAKFIPQCINSISSGFDLRKNYLRLVMKV